MKGDKCHETFRTFQVTEETHDERHLANQMMHMVHICIWYMPYGTAFGMSQTWHKVLPHFRDLKTIIESQDREVHTLCTSRVVSFNTHTYLRRILCGSRLF